MGKVGVLALASLLASAAVSGCVTVDVLTLGQLQLQETEDAVIVEIKLQKPRKFRWSSVIVTARFGFGPTGTRGDTFPLARNLPLDPIPPFQRDRRLYRGVIALAPCDGEVTVTVVAQAAAPGAGTRPRPEAKSASLSLVRSKTSPLPAGGACRD